jgi:hypothetical protein
MTESGLSGKDLTLSWFTKRIQPLQHRERLMYDNSGRDDTMRATKDNLSSDALDKRLRVMIKIPRDVHSHACQFDIYTEGAGPAVRFFRLDLYFPYMPANLPKDFHLY